MNRNCNDKPLFTFAVITDSHINQDETECNSPFEVNRLANRRLRHIVNDLNRRELSAVFHLGDVVHPVPSMGELYTDSATRFFDQINELRHPFHMVPGNHDVGDKKIEWGPAGTIRSEFINAWNDHFGKDHFHVAYHDLHFIGINAQLVGSGLAEEATQQEWVESVCSGLMGNRLFLLTHYPPFLENVDEAEHYDNLSPEGRQWMLELLDRYQFEGLFAGHVHHFWYNRVNQCDCYLLPATSFVRQDYSEMFRIGPAQELGRNDAPKLGYFLVHVYPDGHDFEMVRSFGQESDQLIQSRPTAGSSTPAPNTRNTKAEGFGFDLRQDWMERVQIPPSGGLDEFDRKWVRNDYGLLALWEMGIRRLRIPFQDLTCPDRQQRIRVMRHLGFRFDAYQFGDKQLPEADSLALIDNLEVCWPFARLGEIDQNKLSDIRKRGVGIRLSPLRSKQDILDSGKKYYHVINHGLTLADLNQSNFPEVSDQLSGLIDGWCFRSSMTEDIVDLVNKVTEFDRHTSCRSVIHLRMAPDNPAEINFDELFHQQRIATAMFCTWAVAGPVIYCDALADNDRGYFPRSGVLDRLYNPKAAWALIRNLQKTLNQLDSPGVQICTRSTDNTNTVFAESLRLTLKSEHDQLTADLSHLDQDA